MYQSRTKIYDRSASWILVPVFGTILFVLLYISATFLYPGGSQVDKNAHGFSWINNYWCNLLNETAINNEINPARPVALLAMFILCFTLSLFWYTFPKFLNLDKPIKLTIQIPGVLSMIIALFLFTGLHDAVTNIAGFFGVIALIGTFISLYKIKWIKLFWFGIINLLLVILNNYIYRSEDLLVYLPVIQKITFLSFLSWICCVDITLFQQLKDLQKTK